MEKVIFNGELVERHEAKIDIEDRGFQFGDGIYEVIRVFNGVMFAVEDHLERLRDSAAKIKLNLPYSLAEINKQLQSLVVDNQLHNGIVYLQLTRGVAPRNHEFPRQTVTATFLAYTKRVERPVAAITNGIKAALVEDSRWSHCDIKSINLLGNILAKQQAVELGCQEAIFYRGEFVTEGSAANVSIIKDGILYTHPESPLILSGITRKFLLKLCREDGIPCEEKAFSVEMLKTADEAFISSTTMEFSPIALVDNCVVNNGARGPLTSRLQELLEQKITLQCGPIK